MTKPILLDIPESFDTERLTIRAPRPGDGEPLREAVAETIEHLRPWMPWAQQIPALAEEETVVREGYVRFLKREDLWLLLWLKDSETFVGGSGLHRIDWDIPRFEIGYWCRKRFEGKGYITEAVNGIARFAFDRLKAERVEIRCDAKNVRSAAVARRAGFAHDGTLRRDSRATNGDLRDTLVFSKIKGE